MALDCNDICGKVLADQLMDCNSTIVKGIEQAVLLINRCDIESYTLDITDTTHKATAITLKSGSTGYLIQGVSGKSLFYGSHAINSNDDAPDDFTHTVGLRMYNLTESNLIYIRSLGKGADVVAITLDKAQGDDKYKVYGIENGLKVGEYAQNTNENRGAAIYTLTSKDPDFESYPPVVWLESDEATTDTKYGDKLAVA
jgi:hypothetical protein